MRGRIAISLHGYCWAFDYNTGSTKLHAMDAADKFIRENPDAEIAGWTEELEGTA